MRLSLYEFENGAETIGGDRVVYDIANDTAQFGAAAVEGLALVWQLDETPEEAEGALLSRRVHLDPFARWILRCDRVDFPPGGVAYRHTHPGPGIRRLLFGSIRIDADGHVADYGPSDAWFESGPSPVHATASATEASAFVRVMVLPAEWEGKRTISYVDPADAEKPKLQSAHVYFDRVIAP